MSASLGQTLLLQLDTPGGPVELTVSGAVFDCDGLLVDSESIWLDMLAGWLHQEGPPTPAPEDFLGLSVQDTARQLRRTVRPDLTEGELAGELTARYSRMLEAGVVPMPGAVELLTSLSERIPVAVASNGLRRDVTTMLQESALFAAAHTVCTVEDVSAGKPAPDLYLTACRRLGVQPGSAVAFEDSPAGAQAALAAGLIVVGVNPDASVQLPGELRLTSLNRVRIL